MLRGTQVENVSTCSFMFFDICLLKCLVFRSRLMLASLENVFFFLFKMNRRVTFLELKHY